MSMLDELPKWREHLARAEEARARHARVSAEATREQVEHDAAMTEHRRKTEEAVMSGDPLPDDLPAPSATIAHALRYALSAMEDVQRDGNRLRVALLPEVERIAADRWETRRDEIRDAVETLTRAAREMSTEASELAQLRDSANHARSAPVRPGPGERTLTRWTVQDLADAIHRNVPDPFALAPIPTSESKIRHGYGAPESSPPPQVRPNLIGLRR